MTDDTKPDVPLPAGAGSSTDAAPGTMGGDSDALTAALAGDTIPYDDHGAFIPSTDDSLLGLIVSPDALISVEHTLDQLTTSVDLFDVTPFDFGDHSS
jgi:hypothetical protein